MKVAVFGLGYVGTVSAAVLASNGHRVVGVDVDPAKVQMVRDGQSPVVEPGLNDLVARTAADGCLSATESAADALERTDVSLVCVGTPSSPNGSTELTYLLRAVSDIAEAVCTGGRARHHAIVVRSTIPPGTIEDVVEPMVAERTQDTGARIGVGMCPEFLREGTAIADFYDAPLSVIGTADPCVAELAGSLFGFLPTQLEVVPVRVAEGLKLACNAFHATKVSFANELGRLFRSLGVDSRQVMSLFCRDTKLNISTVYLRPGFAFGGSCLPKDLRSLLYLARMNCLDLPLLSGTLLTNSLAVSDVVNRIVECDAHVVTLVGLSFKADSDDLRESPFVELAEVLIGKGFDVRIFDPVVDTSVLVGTNRSYVHARLPHLQRLLVDDPLEALQDADVALVSRTDAAVVDALTRVRPKAVIDLCGRLGPDVEALPGYQGVGW